MRYLASKIHPPLPLTPRDSQRLLSLLSASFRAHLDKEHGKASSDSSLATNNLLTSILANPLLGLSQQHCLSPPDRAPQKHDRALVKHHKRSRLSPIELFEREIAAGSADIRVAKHYLSAHLQRLTLAKTKRNNGMPSSNSGATILNWLWSSGYEANLEFLIDREFTRVLVSFLVAEGRALHSWSWFRRLQLELQQDSSVQASTKTHTEKSYTQAHLLKALILSEMTYGAGLNGAFEAFVDAFNESSPYFTVDDSVALQAFRRTGSLLLSQFMKMGSTAAINPHVIDKLIENVQSRSAITQIDRACLSLLHPVRRDPYPALRLLQRCNRKLRPPLVDMEQREKAATLLLKASEILINTGNRHDAQWILDHMHYISPLLPGSYKAGDTPAEDNIEQDDSLASEKTSLQELDALTFG